MLRNALLIIVIVILAIVAIKIIFPIVAWTIALFLKVALLVLILVAIGFLYKKLRV